MRKRKIRAGLVGRVKETIRKTRSRVGVEGGTEEDFWTVRGSETGMSAKPAVIQYPTGGLGGEDGAREVGRC